MGIETLGELKEIDGVKIHRIEWDHPEGNFIEINDRDGAITVKMQNGPIKEVGVNGCQFTILVEMAIEILKGLNDKHPSVENHFTLTKWQEGMMWQRERTRDRENRGVEGYDKA